MRPLAGISRRWSEPLASGSCERRLSASGLRLDSWSEIVEWAARWMWELTSRGTHLGRWVVHVVDCAVRGCAAEKCDARGCFAGAESNIVDADWCDADRPLVKDCCPIAISRSHYFQQNRSFSGAAC